MSVFVTLGYSQLLATFLCSLLGDVENSRFNYVQSRPVCYSSVLVHSCPANFDMTKIIHREIKSAFACNMFSAAAAEQKYDSIRQKKWLLQTAQYLRRIRSNTQDPEIIPGEIITVLTEIKCNLFLLLFWAWNLCCCGCLSLLCHTLWSTLFSHTNTVCNYDIYANL